MSLINIEKSTFGELFSLKRSLTIDDFNCLEVKNEFKGGNRIINVGLILSIKKSVVDDFFKDLKDHQNNNDHVLLKHPFFDFFENGKTFYPKNFYIVKRERVDCRYLKNEHQKEIRFINTKKRLTISWEQDKSSMISKFMESESRKLKNLIDSLNRPKIENITSAISNPRLKVEDSFFNSDDHLTGVLSDKKKKEIELKISKENELILEIESLQEKLKSLTSEIDKEYQRSFCDKILPESGPIVNKIIKDLEVKIKF